MRGHRTLGLVGMLLVSVACDKVAEIDVSPDPCRTGETVDLVGKATMRSGKASPVPLKWSLKGDVGSIKDTTLTCGKAGEGSVVAEMSPPVKMDPSSTGITGDRFPPETGQLPWI